MDEQSESKPAVVSAVGPKQAGEPQDVYSRWDWVEPVVWTERMAPALEQGVKGGKWFSLIDKVCSIKNLRVAFQRVKGNKGSPGIDHVSVEMFEENLENNLEELSKSLKEGTYKPQKIKRTWIPKAGKKNEKRPLGIPTVRDRVAQTALRNVIEPIYEKDFAEHSYGFRPKRGCKDALRRVDHLLKEGYIYVVDADLKSYFDTIPHEKLIDLCKIKVADSRVIDLLEKYLKQEVMESVKSWTPAVGTPQGAVISPLLSNIYLDPLDRLMFKKGYEMVRYADDFVILCRSEEEAKEALETVRQWTQGVGLTLHPEKTRIVDAGQKGGFDFLGYHFERQYKWPAKKSLKKFKENIRSKTKRTNGYKLEDIISNANMTLRGWFEYFKHSHKTTFKPIDSWIRMRLRSILRKRQGKSGRGRGIDHVIWPNAFFAGHGLFSLTAAHMLACQSSRR